MLSKTDQSQIHKIIRQEIRLEAKATRRELRSEIKLSKMDTANRIREVENQVKNVGVKVDKIDKRTIKISKDLEATIDFFDHEHLDLRKKVRQIEEHLSLTAS